MQKNSSRLLPKLVWWLLAAVIAAPLLFQAGVITYIFGRPTVEDYAHRMPFDAVGWRDRSQPVNPRWPNRLRMVNDLMARKLLDGRPRADVEALLGPVDETTRWKDWHLVYYFGPERGPAISRGRATDG